jgi:hypothetical protein
MALVLRLYYGLYYGCVVVIHNSSEERFTYSPSGLVLRQTTLEAKGGPMTRKTA